MGNIMAAVNIEAKFADVNLDDDAQEVLNSVQESFVQLAQDIEDSLPESREKSMVATKIEEAYLWAAQCVKVNDVP